MIVKDESIKKRNGYFGLTLMAMMDPTINPADSAVITNDQDFGPLKCSSAISGPKHFQQQPNT